jgi:type IX secretion system PorP/SprF family membrane protein
MRKRKIILPVFLTVMGLTGMMQYAKAQLRPLGAQYYENQYISNAAFAGITDGLNMNISYRNQWRSIPGSPVTMAFSADYRYNKVGLGLNVYNDEAGLIGRTRVMGTYAYHLDLNGTNKSLHFGVSLGVMKATLDNNSIIAEPDDILAERFNQRKAFIDGDFGIAYTNDRLTMQAALPNLKKFFQKDDQNTIDGSTYFAAVSYKIGTHLDVLSLEPKISFRGAKDIDNIWDMGTNLKLENNILSFLAMYHSDKSSTFGVGVNYDRYYIQGFYTSQLAGERQRTGGDFEINLKINFLSKKR